MINLNIDSIIYQATVVLEDLAVEIADSRKKSKLDAALDKAAKIRYFLKAIANRSYLEDEQVNNILQCLVEVSGIQDFPVTPTLPTLTVPDTGNTIIIEGTQGPKGDTGGATDFSVAGVTSTTVVDSFAITEAYAARWDYIVNGTAQRAGSVIGTWTEDGASIDGGDLSSPDVNGSTSAVSFTVEFLAGNVRLVANVTSGTWTISGSRYLIPNNGAGVVVSNTPLSQGFIFIGNSSNVPQEQAVTGDIAITTGGVTSISSGVIVNGDINGSAAIAVSKLAALPNNNAAVVSDASGFITTVAGVSATEVGYLANVTSDIQTQLDSKLSGATGAISTVTAVDLTPSRAVVSNPAGKIAVSGTTSTELGYVSGVTSAIQTQLNGKQASGTYVDSPDAVQLHTKVISIGDWNMDSVQIVFITHGISNYKKIRSVDVIVRDDADSTYEPLVTAGVGYVIDGSIDDLSSTQITLSIRLGGHFDNTNYDSTSFNRGFITILYEA